MRLLDEVEAGYLSLEEFLCKASYGDRGEAPMSIRSMKVKETDVDEETVQNVRRLHKEYSPCMSHPYEYIKVNIMEMVIRTFIELQS